MNALVKSQPTTKQVKQRLWNVVWRAAFMVLGDEDKAEKIANEATNPSAVKDDVVVPGNVSAPNQETWVCVYKAALNNCGNEDQAKSIAYQACGQSDSVSDEGRKSVTLEKISEKTTNSKKEIAVANGSLVVQKNGGSVKVSAAVKSVDNNSPEEGWVEGYLVSWGSTKDTDLQGEFFSPRTEFCLDWFGERPVLYHHGMDDSTGLKKIGVFKSVKVDNIGLWVQAQLDLRDRYARAVYDMVAAKQFGWSSGSVDHLVKIGENGEILVWPLIEGSITPTPAQPAKTAVRPIKATYAMSNSFMTMQAFKAVLSGDAKSSEYLRGLDEHISSADVSTLLRNASARVATQKTIATRTYNNNGFIEGDSNSMARNTESAWYITRAVAKAFGIKDASPEELNAVASEVQGVVQDEVDAAAAQALEDEAKAADVQSQVAATASYNRNRQQNRGQAYRQALPSEADSIAQDEVGVDTVPVASYRSNAMRQAGPLATPVAPATMQDANLGEPTAQDDVTAPAAASYRNAMRQVSPAPTNNIEAAMMNEIAAQMEDDQMEQNAARALRRRAWNRAMRQIADTPETTAQYDATMQDPETVAQYDATMQDPDAATIASYNRARAQRNFASRQAPVAPPPPPAAMQDPVMAAMMADGDGDVDDATQQDPNAVMGEEIISDVAQASYRRGFRSGLRSAFRQLDPGAPETTAQYGAPPTMQDPAVVENQAVASEIDEVTKQTGDSDVVAQAARAYRAGYRRGLRRAVRQLEQETQAEDSTMQDPTVAPATAQDPLAQASYRAAMRQAAVDESTAQDAIVPDGTIASYGMRSHQQRQFQPQRGFAYRDGIIGEPPQAFQGDPEMIAQYDATMQDPEMIAQYDATMQDPEMIAQYDAMAQYDAAMQDPETVAQYDATMQDSILPPGSAQASYGYGQRGYSAEPVYGQRGYGYRQLDPSLPQGPSAMQDGVVADQISAAMMADDMIASMQDSQFSPADSKSISGVTPVRTNNPQAFRSAGPEVGTAYDAQRQAEYWRRRAQELETLEAPGQRAFKSLGPQSIKDVADRPGVYASAFKSYLMKGLGLMTETEKYVLTGKGKARWENASFSYDTATKSVKTYSSGSDASVGFLVPEDWVNELNKNVMTQTVMAPECKTRTTTSDRIVQPNLNTSDARRAHPAQVRWPGEAPASNTDHRTVEDEYTQVTIPIHVMLITLAATNSALEDATFNLEEEINEAFAEAVAVSYDQLIWGGDGQGKLQGIVTNNQVVGSPSLGMKTVGGYVATGSTEGIVTADTLKTMLFHLPQGYRQRAKWYMNSNTGLQIATLKDGMGNYLIDQRDDALRTVGVPDRLLNKPIVYNEWADDAEAGKFPIVLADLTRGYIIGRRVEFSIRRFDDSNYAEHDQVLFLGRARLGGQVLQPASFKALKVALS